MGTRDSLRLVRAKGSPEPVPPFHPCPGEGQIGGSPVLWPGGGSSEGGWVGLTELTAPSGP